MPYEMRPEPAVGQHPISRSRGLRIAVFGNHFDVLPLEPRHRHDLRRACHADKKKNADKEKTPRVAVSKGACHLA